MPANPDELYTQCVDEPHQGVYKILWHRKWNRPTTNANGTTGRAEILETTNDQLHFGKITRVHLCARTPCTARYKANKYGVFPVPVLCPPETLSIRLSKLCARPFFRLVSALSVLRPVSARPCVPYFRLACSFVNLPINVLLNPTQVT